MKDNILADDLDYVVEQLTPVLNDLKKMRLFITGGTGFIGSWLVEALLWANQHLNLDLSLCVLTRNKEAFAKKAPHLIKNSALSLQTGDVRDFQFSNEKFSHIIHAATEASADLNQRNPQLMVDTIIQGTQRVLDFSEHTKAEKVLFVSSGAVYGKQPSDIANVAEQYNGSPNVFDPKAAYAIGKYAAEHLCVLHANQYQREIKIARCFAFVGPYLPLDQHFAIGNFIRDGLSGHSISVNSDGSAYRSYQYASELSIWLIQILCKGNSCTPYNVGSDESISILDLANTVADHFHPRPAVNVAKPKNNTVLAERYVPSIEQAKTLGLKNNITLQQAIEKTIHWHRKRSLS